MSSEPASTLEQVRHEENLFWNRGNFFLVGESMLFAGAATLISQPTVRPALNVFYGLGIFLTIIWLLVNVLHHHFTRMPLKQMKGWQGWLRLDKSWWWMGFAVPLGLAIAWLALLMQ
jgi:hypothetical protein